MKVIFLDIDGVLNTSQTFIDINNEYKKTGIRRVEIDLSRVELLSNIVQETNSVIVLSSSWRVFGKMINNTFTPLNDKMKSLIEIFKKYNLLIHDITPYDKNRIRQNEILSWLENKNVDSFVILDDDPYDLQFFVNNGLIKTSTVNDNEMIKNMDHCIGLCENHVNEAIKLLNKNKTLQLKKLY